MDIIIPNNDALNNILELFQVDYETLFILIHTNRSIRKAINTNKNLPNNWKILKEVNIIINSKLTKSYSYNYNEYRKLRILNIDQTKLLGTYLTYKFPLNNHFKSSLITEIQTSKNNIKNLEIKNNNIKNLLNIKKLQIEFSNNNNNNILLKYIFKDYNKYVYVNKLYLNQKSNFIHISNCGALKQSYNCKCITLDDAINLNNLINIRFCSKCIFQDIKNKIKQRNS